MRRSATDVAQLDPLRSASQPGQGRAVGRSWTHLVAMLALVAGLAVYYRDYLTGRAFIWEDMLSWYYPAVNYFSMAVAGGRFPFWLPGLLNGVPLYTDFQTAMFYPLCWLLALFVTEDGLPFLVYQRYIVLHLCAGALAMYGYLKSHRLGAVACLAGSLTFGLTGFAALHIIHAPMLQVYAWLPVQLWLVDRVVARQRVLGYAGLTVAILMSLFAGFPQTTLYNSYLVIAYWLVCEYRAWPAFSSRKLAGVLGRVAGVYVAVLLLGAIAIVPTYEHMQLSSRAEMDLHAATQNSLPWRNLIQLVVPNFFGVTDFVTKGANFWGFDRTARDAHSNLLMAVQYWEFGAYAGQLSLLALGIIVWNRRLWRGTPVGFYVGAWLLALWFMLGRHGGLFDLLYSVAPGMNLFRSPTRMACVFGCCSAVLVAFATDAVSRQPTVRLTPALGTVLGAYTLGGAGLLWFGTHIYPELADATRMVATSQQTVNGVLLAAGIAAALLALRAQRPGLKRIGGVVVAGLVLADLYIAYAFFHRGRSNPDHYFDANSWVMDGYKDHIRHHGDGRFAQLIDGRLGQWVLDRSLPMVETDFETPQGHFDLFPSHVARVRGLTNQQVLLDLQNVSLTLDYITSTAHIDSRHRATCLPRVKFYGDIRRYASDDEILADLDAGRLDYHRTVAVRAEQLGAAMPAPAVAAGWGAAPQVRLIRDTPEHYQIQYAVSTPGLLFVSETFYPGWEAEDATGRPCPIVPAFVAFKGIVIAEAGQGVIDVRFRPRSFRVGAAISGSTAMGLLLLFGCWKRRESKVD